MARVYSRRPLGAHYKYISRPNFPTLFPETNFFENLFKVEVQPTTLTFREQTNCFDNFSNNVSKTFSNAFFVFKKCPNLFSQILAGDLSVTAALKQCQEKNVKVNEPPVSCRCDAECGVDSCPAAAKISSMAAKIDQLTVQNEEWKALLSRAKHDDLPDDPFADLQDEARTYCEV